MQVRWRRCRRNSEQASERAARVSRGGGNRAFRQTAGEQEWTKIFLEEPFESGKYKEVGGVLEASVDGFAFVVSGVESTDEVTAEENIKIVG